MQGIEEVRALLAIPKNILITSHRNPDGDAIGSSQALALWLKSKGHRVMVAFPSEYPANYQWMPGVQEIQIFDIESEPIFQFCQITDIHIIADYNSLSRIDKMAECLGDRTLYTILIDHHLYPDPIGDFVLSDTSASSTCELVYQFISACDQQPLKNLDIAACIYTGILTDTGSFQYSTSPGVFRLAATLQELGIDTHQIYDQIFNTLDEKSLRLLGHCLANRMEILEEYKTGIIFLNKHDFQIYNIQRGDTEGIVNYLLKLKNVHMAVFVQQQPTIMKLSFRSKGNISVEEIAKTHFNGGGHRNAAGGFARESLSATLDRVRSLLPIYKEQLIKPII